MGEKARFADRRITVNADIYYIKWSDIQQVISLTCGYPYNTNAGNAKSYGPELEVSALIVKGLTLDFSGSYNTAVINDPSANAIAAGITPGTRVLSVPKYSGQSGAQLQAADHRDHERVAECLQLLGGHGQGPGCVPANSACLLSVGCASRSEQRPMGGLPRTAPTSPTRRRH